MATQKPTAPPEQRETYLRIRLPEATKKLLAHLAVDHGMSQQAMAQQLIERAMAVEPRMAASKSR